jgi:protocatechuate 3,4-dioxygenase beta subunit
MKKSSIDRRRFLRWGGTGIAATTMLGACRPKAGAQGDAAPSTFASSQEIATPGQVASTVTTPPQLEAICQRTAKNIEGPFFRASAPFRASVVPSRTPLSQIFRLRGRVLDSGCKPLADAIVEFWQADKSGAYDHRGFAMRTRVKTDAGGNYALDTIVPGRYLNGDLYRPAHIHAKVHALGHRSLTTQLYFSGDPYNDKDPWFLATLVMQPGTDKSKNRHSIFDFYLGESNL